MTFLEAAAKILSEKGHAMRPKEIVALALQKGYLSTAGATPDYTLGSVLSVDVKKPVHVLEGGLWQTGRNGIVAKWRYYADRFQVIADSCVNMANKVISLSQMSLQAVSRHLLVRKPCTRNFINDCPVLHTADVVLGNPKRQNVVFSRATNRVVVFASEMVPKIMTLPTKTL